jgi:peptidoglycan/xylan/chitin deacetylase (PgdA/CDA1 family)
VNLPQLTFDDGPSEFTAPILNVLKEHGVQAIFFVLGVHARAHPDLIRRIDADGHEIGNHGDDHDGLLNERSEAQVREKLEPVCKLLEELIGKRPRYFRPPYGKQAAPHVKEVARSLEMVPMYFDVNPEDFKRPGVDVIAKAILDAGPDQIILLHDGAEPGTSQEASDRNQTVEALKRALSLRASEPES